MGGDISVSDFFEVYSEFGASTHLSGSTAASPEDLFSILEALDGVPELPPTTPLGETVVGSKEMTVEEMMTTIAAQKSVSSSSGFREYSEAELEASPERKRRRLTAGSASREEAKLESLRKVSHIAVERNRRKQMNEQLVVLRSLMPGFYVKRGDQATIIEGVVQYIKELQQLLQSLEAKKQRKVYTEVLSPRLNASSPRPSSVPSPRKPPLSPRLTIPISPRTPQQPSSPYKPWLHQPYLSPTMPSSPSSTATTTSNIDNNVVNDMLVVNSRSAVAAVEVKFSGPNLLLKTTSPRMPGQACKIVSALEDLSLEILHVSISTTIDGTMLNSFTIKIGIECQLSAEELAHQIHQTFC